MLWESKNNGFEGDGEVGERGCGEQGSYRVPGMTLQAPAGVEEQSLPSAPRQDHLSSRPVSPQGTSSCSPARLSSHMEGALRAGVSHKHYPSSPALWHCMQRVVLWAGLGSY